MMHHEQFQVIYKHYQPLLKSLANRYCVRGAYEEAYAEAACALYEAYMHFDPSKGHFAPYAKSYVRGKLLNLIQKEIRYLEQHMFPSQYEDEEGNWLEQLVSGYADHSSTLSSELVDALGQLSKREQLAIIHYYVRDRSLEELAKLEGVTHSTVSTWKRRGLGKLQKILSAHPYQML